MPRPKTKEELVLASKENYENLKLFISNLSEEELQTPFDFSRDQKKKEGHWKSNKNLRDVLRYLYGRNRVFTNNKYDPLGIPYINFNKMVQVKTLNR